LTALVERAGGRIATSASSRQAMFQTLQRHQGVLGGGASHRLWFAGKHTAGIPTPDALRAFTLLLVLLSDSDAPLSERLAGLPG
jgi:hypothetical protein